MRAGSSLSTAPAASVHGSGGRTSLAVAWVAPSELRFRPIESKRSVLGRGADADCVVGGPEASRHHAEIWRDGPLWLIRDLNSRNGTFVGGRAIEQGPIGPGSVIRIGDAVGVAVLEPEGDLDPRPFREVAPGLFAGAALQRTLERVRPAAESDLPIIVQGETGSGKERLARWIHAASARSGPFVALNCAALPEALAEAELFGYRRGAFTGAVQASPGHFRAANGGTLLLDEILDLPLPLQAKLLRVLEERQVTPLGEAAPVSIDVRVIAASQASLEDAVRAHEFRGDLFARLDGLNLILPPLRERVEDIAPLFRRFVTARCGGRPPAIEARLIEALCLYDWPFNVRELELLARRLSILHGHEPMLTRAQLPERMAERVPASGAAASGAPAAPDEYARFVTLLRAHRGVVARAAEAAGISRMRAYRLMKEHDLDPNAVRAEREP